MGRGIARFAGEVSGRVQYRRQRRRADQGELVRTRSFAGLRGARPLGKERPGHGVGRPDLQGGSARDRFLQDHASQSKVAGGLMSRTSRRTFLQMAPAAAVLTAIGRAADGGPEPSPTTLWYQQPATKWEEALAIGNGRLGAMIFGGVEKERLQLNEITIWSGRLEPEADRPEAYKALPAIRQLIDQGKYPEANKAMNEQRTCLKEGRAGAGTYGSYQTLGD